MPEEKDLLRVLYSGEEETGGGWDGTCAAVFELKDGSEGNLADEIMFNKEIIKDKMGDETFTLYLED